MYKFSDKTITARLRFRATLTSGFFIESRPMFESYNIVVQSPKDETLDFGF